MSCNVIIENAVKKYGDFTAVNKISVKIKKGEFFTLLGPSGCGKTTLLRMIAGFNSIDGGQIFFDDKIINNVDAHKRDIGMVFQNYAIFPHMNVYENVAYGLKSKKVHKDQIDGKVKEALELVQITALKDRKPSELSGGQQQRVALARAIVIEPRVLLMDEPLSNLDAKLRVQMRTIIKKLQKRLGITTVYVTHDQEEALAISDRIAVMKDGNLMQVGTPEMIYKKPNNSFVSNFIGTSNFLTASVKESDEKLNTWIEVEHYQFQVDLKKPANQTALISMRPEQLSLNAPTAPGMLGHITIQTFLGDFVNYEIELKSGAVIEVNEYTKDTDLVRSIGDEVSITFNPKKINIFSAAGEESLL